MKQELINALSHVLWIGGAPDSGKSTIAQELAGRHQLQAYHYDQHDLAHHEQLAQTSLRHRAFLNASLDERWVQPEPEMLMQRSLGSFRDRFPLVIEDLLALPNQRQTIAEGFGLLPELLASVLSHPAQAIWLIPSESFKRASMKRRGKPSFSIQVSDPERAKSNLLARDMLLAAYIEEQASAYGYTVQAVDGLRSPEALANLLEQHFAPFLFN